MDLKEAVSELNKHIPEPRNKMVDQEHIAIAVAWETIKEHLNIAEAGRDSEGICPICGGELEFSDNIQMDDGGVYPWECKSCGATGEQGYDEVFDGHHYNVRRADGSPLSGREEKEK